MRPVVRLDDAGDDAGESFLLVAGAFFNLQLEELRDGLFGFAGQNLQQLDVDQRRRTVSFRVRNPDGRISAASRPSAFSITWIGHAYDA